MVLIPLIPKGLADYILIFDIMTTMLANLFNFKVQEVIFDEIDVLSFQLNQNVTIDVGLNKVRFFSKVEKSLKVAWI